MLKILEQMWTDGEVTKEQLARAVALVALGLVWITPEEYEAETGEPWTAPPASDLTVYHTTMTEALG